MTYDPPPHVTAHWHVAKPGASGRRGMVASQSRDAAEAGVAILDAGGNAIDAAVATALALPTVEPWNSGLGGIGFAVIHRAGQPRAEVVEFGPRAPRGLDPSAYKLTGRQMEDLFAWPGVVDDCNVHGPLSFAIPSAVAGYAFMHGRWGRLPQKTLLEPAIALAKRGLSQDWYTTLKIAAAAPVLRKYDESARIYLPDGLPRTPPYQGVPGFFRLGRLGDTLERLQANGLRDFYEGETARLIADDVAALGGFVSLDDLRHCEARVAAPLEVAWQGRTVQLTPTLTAGPTFAHVLSLMQDVPRGATPDAAWYRGLARAMRAAYADRLSGLGDAEPLAAESCTTHLTTCDEEGTICAVTTTLLSSMGSRVVLPQSGVLMNNGIMWFDPRPGQPNSIAPGKRPLTNMCPIVLRDGDAPMIGIGASGGRRIMAAVYQMLAFVSEFGMTPEQAAHQPRIDVSDPDGVSADRRLSPDIIDALSADAPVEIVDSGVMPTNFACPNLILSRDGSRMGVTDAYSPWSAAIAQG